MTEQLRATIPPLDAAFADDCRTAARQIEAALAETGTALISAAEKIVPLVVRLRDRTIAARRAEPASPVRDAALTNLNIALTLVIAVGYPEGPPQRPYLEQARDLLLALARQAQQAD